MPHSRISLWHRVTVLIVVTFISAAILVWGYILNVGTLIVHVQPGDSVRIDGSRYSADGRVRAGERTVVVERAHYERFQERVVVPRDGVVELTPELTFLPYRTQGRAVTLPVVPTIAQADGFVEQLESSHGAPEGPIPPELFPGDTVAARLSSDGLRIWLAQEDGVEEVRALTDGMVLWTGKTVGRAFRATTFIAATRDDDERIAITAHTDDGSIERIGTVDAKETVTLVPHPLTDEVLVIHNATGIATLVGSAGRIRLPLREAAVNARWSPDGARILFLVRLPGAAGSTKLLVYDRATQREQELPVRTTIELATFVPESTSVLALERSVTADAAERLLADTRVGGLLDALEQQTLSFEMFQDALPADLRLTTIIAVLDVVTGERTELVLDGASFTSETLRLDPGQTPGTIDVLLPTHLETVVLAPGASS